MSGSLLCPHKFYGLFSIDFSDIRLGTQTETLYMFQKAFSNECCMTNFAQNFLFSSTAFTNQSFLRQA